MTDKAGPVGPVLAAARQRRGWSLEEVATRTRIRSTLLARMEADDFSGCGGAVYARGHIRSYALAVGLDPEPLIEAFDATHDTRPPTMAAGTLLTAPVRREARGSSNPRWMPAAIGAVVVLLLLTLIGIVAGNKNNTKTQNTSSPKASPNATVTPRKTQASPTPTPTPTATTLARGNVGVMIRLVGGNSWMRVTDQDGRVLVQDTLLSGTERTFLATRSLTLLVGNAGAVELACNNRFLGPAGRVAQVATVTLDGLAPECSPGG